VERVKGIEPSLSAWETARVPGLASRAQVERGTEWPGDTWVVLGQWPVNGPKTVMPETVCATGCTNDRAVPPEAAEVLGRRSTDWRCRPVRLRDGPAAEAIMAQMVAHEQTRAEIAAWPVRRCIRWCRWARPGASAGQRPLWEGRRAILAEWGVTVARGPFGTREVARLEIGAAGPGRRGGTRAIAAELDADEWP
jgi:hypothetical protein